MADYSSTARKRRSPAWSSLTLLFLASTSTTLTKAVTVTIPGCILRALPPTTADILRGKDFQRRRLNSRGSNHPKHNSNGNGGTPDISDMPETAQDAWFSKSRWAQLDVSDFDIYECQQYHDMNPVMNMTFQFLEDELMQEFHVERNRNHPEALKGKTDGDGELNVVWGEMGDMAGSAQIGDTIYQFATMEDGSVWSSAILRKDLPPEGAGDEDPLLLRQGQQRMLRNTPDEERHLQEDPSPFIDIMVPFTRRVMCAIVQATSPNRCGVNARRLEMVQTRIELAIQESNVAFENSGIPGRFRLVHTYLVNDEDDPYYDEMDAASYTDILLNVGYPTDGVLDNMHVERGKAGADVVSFWVANPSSCGLAFAGAPVEAAWAFSVINWECASGYYSFVHEISHHLGAHHDRTAKRCPDPFCCQDAGCYAYGYQDPLNRFRSIMAYDCLNAGGCPRVLYFSQPEIKYPFRTSLLSLGSSSVNNARMIREQFAAVASFKATKVITTPVTNDPTPETCGNGVCEPLYYENCQTCPQDCVGGTYEGHVCGNNICEVTENCKNCPSDCPGRLKISNESLRYCCEGGPTSEAGGINFGTPCTGGHPYCKWNTLCSTDAAPSQPTSFCCGNGICENGEGVWNCPVDCPCRNDGRCDYTFEDKSCLDCQQNEPTQCMADARFCNRIIPDPCCGNCNTRTRKCENG